MNLDTFLNRYFKPIYALGILIGLALAIIYADNQIIGGDQNQMLYKGYLGAYNNVWLSYGNAASAVGNVPGYLSGLLVGGPLLLWDSPWSPMLFLIGLRLICFCLLDCVVKKTFKPSTRITFLFLFWLNPWLLYDSILYNPSYLCFFAALHLWSAFHMKNGKSFFYSFIHVLSIGMAMQLHYSWPVLVVISLYLFYRNMGDVSWTGVVVASLILIASLIPYLQELAVNESISRESDRYIGYGLTHVYPIFKAVLYWLRYGSFLFSNKAIASSNFEWISNIDLVRLAFQYLWKAIAFGVGALTIILSIKFNWSSWKRIRPIIKRSSEELVASDWLLLYAFGAFLATLTTAALSPITFSYWHLIILYPIALIPIVHAIERWGKKNTTKYAKIAVAAIVYLMMVNLMAAHDSLKFSFNVNYTDQVNTFLKSSNFKPL